MPLNRLSLDRRGRAQAQPGSALRRRCGDDGPSSHFAFADAVAAARFARAWWLAFVARAFINSPAGVLEAVRSPKASQ